MKYIKSYILLALMVLAVTGCKQEDLKDDVNALKDRVTLLEEQVKLLNENIAFFSKVLVCQTIDNGDGTFNASVKVSDSPGFYQWLAAYGKNITVLEPENVRQNYIKYLRDTLNNYL